MRPSQLLQHALQSATVTDFPTFAFSEHWQLLGPFQIGTREALWGADPLEQYGGFRNLTFDDRSRFPSSLPFNATTSWSNVTAKLGDPNIDLASAELSVEYADVDWAFLQQVYGWAALQWQGWARGDIIVQATDPVTLALNAMNNLEFWVDDKQYLGGDFYGFSRAPAVLHLEPGVHRIDVRLIRDVRSMGGITKNPTVDIKLELQASRSKLQQCGKVLFADRIEEAAGLLAGSLSSFVLRNNIHEDIWIESIRTRPQIRNICETLLVNDGLIKITPGQSRPIAFRVSCVPGATLSKILDFKVTYHVASQEQEKLQFFVTAVPETVQKKYEPQKFTYLHPGGMVSYAILRPPSPDTLESCNVTDGRLPVLLALHGAGLEADNEMVRHALDPLANICAWVLFPTGVTPWSGDDWHTWGLADIEAAVNAIPEWIEHNSWTGPGVDTDKWLVVGHSNGGQGTWHILTHRPDKVIAAAPLSGYSSIQNYVPYHFWHPADPRKTAIVQASLGSYRHELLLGNTKDTPILQQHGSADVNVPAYHSRLMHQLLPQSDSASTYHEMEGKPHYWDGVMTTQPLSDFIQHYLVPRADRDDNTTKIHRPFTITTMNPADTGPLHGIRIMGLAVPGQVGKVEVMLEGLHDYIVYTNNVRTLEISAQAIAGHTISVDDESVDLDKEGGDISVIELTSEGKWIISDRNKNNSLPETRKGRQLGSVDSILRTKGAFQIVHHPSQHNEAVSRVALQVSRNLCQYFSADTEITANMSEAINDRTGNVISIFLGVDIPQQASGAGAAPHGIRVHRHRVETRDARGTRHGYRSRGNGLAAIYLRPLPDERLELVVWGVDEASLRIAARLVPLMTGVGVPDFVIADSTMLWKGVEGTLAMGFLDENWQASSNAIFT
jgi:pimeloyl-ACP methyl ester carboxylesterase